MHNVYFTNDDGSEVPATIHQTSLGNSMTEHRQTKAQIDEAVNCEGND